MPRKRHKVYLSRLNRDLPDPRSKHTPSYLIVDPEELAEAISELPAWEEEIVLRCFGIHGGHAQPLRRIGRSLNLSHEKVRQLREQALRRLRVRFNQPGPNWILGQSLPDNKDRNPTGWTGEESTGITRIQKNKGCRTWASRPW
jgi:hypothetical protein